MKCTACEYDLAGLSYGARCPECGTAFAAKVQTARLRGFVMGRILMVTGGASALAMLVAAIFIFGPGAIASGVQVSLDRMSATATFESFQWFLFVMLVVHFVLGMACIGLRLDVRRCREFPWLLWVTIGVGFVVLVFSPA